MTTQKKYIVAIKCLVYNHEKYLRQTLEGFVMQKTNFPFYAVVHDDASTDSSPEIIREYAEKYPYIIHPIYEKENQYSKHDGSLTRIVHAACSNAKYVAFCEGDDYWTDPLKLQKQVDFLESHPDYNMCFHTAIQHWEDGCKPDEVFRQIEDREYTGEELFKTWTAATASVMLRRSVIESDIYKRARQNKKFIYGDIVTWLSAAHEGKVWGMSDVMSVYRKQSEGVTAKYSSEHIKDQAYHSLEIYKVFGEQYKRISIDKFAIDAMDAFFGQKADGRIDYSLLCDLIRYAPKQTISKFVSMVAGKIFI